MAYKKLQSIYGMSQPIFVKQSRQKCDFPCLEKQLVGGKVFK